MRALGVDFGQRRIGLALSDASGVLARPWRSLPAGATPAASAAALAALLAQQQAAGDDAAAEITTIVVGLPRRLSGEDTDQTQPAREFAAALQTLLHLDVHLQDERLTSREAESRLARRERDWRRRKAQLDAAAAAVILQDYLDERSAVRARDRGGASC
jgi:putative Holliday junction resolvase